MITDYDNQKLVITGKMDQLSQALKFAMKYLRYSRAFKRKEDPLTCIFTIAPDGSYCLGSMFKELEKGWTPYPFDYNPKIIGDIIRQHFTLRKSQFEKNLDPDWDHYELGFRLQIADVDDDIELFLPNPDPCILIVSPMWLYYGQ